MARFRRFARRDAIVSLGVTVADEVRCELDGPVGVVTLQRPHRLNAINGPMRQAMLSILEQLADDTRVRSVILTGEGRAFCAGGDIRDGGGDDRDASAHDRLQAARRSMEIVERLRAMPKAVIAAINGACAGAGIAWACAADLRVAGTSARFKAAYLDIGLSGDYGVTWTLPRIVGAGRAAEMLLLGEMLGASDAERIGLVNLVVSDDQLRPTALEMAHKLATASPPAIAALKANLVEGQTLDFSTSLDRETERLLATLATREATEAARAFARKH